MIAFLSLLSIHPHLSLPVSLPVSQFTQLSFQLSLLFILLKHLMQSLKAKTLLFPSGRTSFGVLYLLSFGLLGWGWFVDLLRMPCLVQSVNRKNREKYEQLLTLQQQLAQQRQQQQQQQPGHQQHLPPHNVVFVAFEPKSLGDAYVLWFPCGILGESGF